MTIIGVKSLEPLINHFIKLSLDGQNRYDPQVFQYGINRQRNIEIKAGSSNQRKVKILLLLNHGETQASAIYPAIYIYPEYHQAFSVYGLGDMIKDEYKHFPYFDNIPTIKSYFDKQDLRIAQNIKLKATRYDYLHNKYKNSYSLINYTASNPAINLASDMLELSNDIDRYFGNINFYDYFKNRYNN